MKFDKLSLFADGLTVPTTASASTYSKVIDLRKCGEIGIDGMLRVWAGIVGTANTTGSITTTLQTFDGDGSGVTDLVSATQNDNVLMELFVPCKGVKRFLRVKFEVGATALNTAVTVKAGLVDQFDIVDLPTVQTYPPLEDLTTVGDAVNTALNVAETSKSITKGSSADIAITAGVVASYSAPTGYTVTVSASKVTIALASTAASGSVTLNGTTGNTKTITVTAAS